jgi:hypothetical protein
MTCAWRFQNRSGAQALGVVGVSADDDVARIAQHRNDMQVPVDQKPWADDMEVNGILGEIDADVPFVPAQLVG